MIFSPKKTDSDDTRPSWLIGESKEKLLTSCNDSVRAEVADCLCTLGFCNMELSLGYNKLQFGIDRSIDTAEASISHHLIA